MKKQILFFFIFLAGALLLGAFQIAYAQPDLQTTTPGLCGGSGWFYYTTCPNYAAANKYNTCFSHQTFVGGNWTYGPCYDEGELSGWTFSGGSCQTNNFCIEPTYCVSTQGNSCQACNNIGQCNYGIIQCDNTCSVSVPPKVYDSTSPTGSLSAIPSAISSGETITLYLQGYDETGILYLSWTDNNGTHWQNCNGGISCAASGPLTLLVPKADYIFVGTIIDVGGNSAFIKSNTVTVTDNVAPTGSISISPNPVAPGQNFIVTMTGQDAGGLFALTWNEDGYLHENSSSYLVCPSGTSINAPCTATWGGTKLNLGNYTISGIVTDLAKNKTDVYTVLTVIDTTPPMGSMAAWPSQVNVGQSINLYLQGYDKGKVASLTWTAKDSNGNVVRSGSKTCNTYTSNPDMWNGCDWTTYTTIYTSDTYTFSGTVTDFAGNTISFVNAYGPIKVGSGVATCSAPLNFAVSANSGNSITMKWDPVPGATSYRMDYFDLTKFFYTPIITSDTQTTISNLIKNTTYTFNVRAETSDGSCYAPGPASGQTTVLACAKTQAPLTDTVTLPNNCSVAITHLGKDATDYSAVSYEPSKALTASNTNYIAVSDNPPSSCNDDITFHNTWNPTAVDPYNFFIDSRVDSYSAGNILEYGYQLSTDTCVVAQNFECSYTSGNTCPMPNIAPNNKSVAVFGRQTNSFDPAQSLKEFAFNFRIVPDAPWIPIFTPQNQWYKENPLLSIMMSDTELPLAHAYYAIDSAVSTGNPTTIFTDTTNVGKTYFPWAGFSISDEAWSNLSEGPHTIYFAAYNSAGFCTGCDGQISFAFNKDTTAPTSTIEDFMAKKISINNAPIQPPQSLGSPRPSDNTFWFGEGTWEIPISDTDLGSTFGTGSGIDPNSCSYTIQDLGPNSKTRNSTRTCNGNITITVGPTGDCQTQKERTCNLVVKSKDKANNPNNITSSTSFVDLNIDYTPPTAQ